MSSHSNQLRSALVIVTLAVLASPGRADIVWQESAKGDLSNSQSSPSSVTLGLGVNSVIGSVGPGDSQDWITLVVPKGIAISSIKNSAYSSTDAQGFTGFQAGSTFVGNPQTQPAAYNGYVHFGTGARNGSLPVANLVNAELINLMADNTNAAAGAKGFTQPLGEGSYTFLIQQLGATTNYQFDYSTVAVVPEPSSLCLLCLTGAAFVARRRVQRSPKLSADDIVQQ